jgi:hypothetical protein
MSKDPIRGKTFSFTFDDGPMAGSTFEHRFADNGTVTFHALGGGSETGRDKPVSMTARTGLGLQAHAIYGLDRDGAVLHL